MDTTVPSTPERKRFSFQDHITVTNLVSPVTSLFRNSKKTPVPRNTEAPPTAALPPVPVTGYENFQSKLATLPGPEKKVAPTLSRRNFDRPPRPSIGVLLENFGEKARDNGLVPQTKEENPEKREKLLHAALAEIPNFASFSWDEYILSKEEFEKQTKSIEELKIKLKSEMRMRDGAATLVRAQKDKKLSKQAREQFESSERRVGQLSSEVWRLSQSTNFIHQRLLEHTAVVLARAFKEEHPAPAVRTEVQQNSVIGDDAISILKVQLSQMSSKLDAIIDSKEERRRSFEHGDNDSGMGHERRSWHSIDHRDSWHSEKDETIHQLTQQVDTLKAELQQAQNKIVDYERKATTSEADNPRVNELVRTSLKNAIVEKERYRIELEKEKALRQDLTNRMEALQHGDQEKEAVQNLRDRLEESIRDIDVLRDENEDVKGTLRQLFALCPNYSPTHTYSDDEEEEKFTLDGFVRRISYLIEENHHLMDRVLELQSENERYRTRDRRSKSGSGLEDVFHEPAPVTYQSRAWLESSDEEDSQT